MKTKQEKNIVEEQVENKIFEQKTKIKPYLGFKTRLIVLIILFLTSYLTLSYMVRNGFTITEPEKINVSEKSNIDYKVYLKENEFYDIPYLNKDMSYVPDLIKNIKIDFNYNFNIDKTINCNFTYDIIGKLAISNPDNNTVFFEKDYTLKEQQTLRMKNQNKQSIIETISIDYDKYNDLANKFKTLYGLSSDSKLSIYMKINKTSDFKAKNSTLIDNSSTMLVTIPLTDKAVNIKIDGQDINNYGEVVEDSNFIIDNIVFIAVAGILLGASLYLIIRICRMIAILNDKKSKYDKYIEKLLKEYDRLIVETTSMPKLDNLTVFKVNKFSELLDVRDNIKLPIMYYNVTKHSKCHLYIKNNNDLYLLTIKSVDMD